MRWGLFFVVLCVVVPVLASELSNKHTVVPLADDLTVIASQSDKEKLPILLMFFAEDCEYCERLEQDIINPMLVHGDFNNRVIVRKVLIDQFDTLTNFAGVITDSDEFANQRGIQVTPTLQFVDSNGQELVPQVIGYQGPDFFSAYLDDALGGSLQKIRQQ